MPQWLFWSLIAQTQLRKIDQKSAMRIFEAIMKMRDGHGNIKPLNGYDPPRKRIRVGDYRVVYIELGDGKYQILRVGRRNNVYND